jgi:hypothetical protein
LVLQVKTEQAADEYQRSVQCFHEQAAGSTTAIRAYDGYSALLRELGDSEASLEMLQKARHFSRVSGAPRWSGHQELSYNVSDSIIGNGGEARVFLGTLGSTEVAVRAPHFLHGTGASPVDRSVIKRMVSDLKRFVHVWSKMPPHGNLLKLLHVVEEDMTLDDGERYEHVPMYMFTDLCVCTLWDELEAIGQGRLQASMELPREVGAQVAAGLACLHRKRHVHRDIKANNILKTTSGLWKVGDFGLLRDNASRTMQRSLCGNLLHRAPEQWATNRGNRLYAVYSLRADVWSFGILLLEILDALAGFAPLSNDRVSMRLYRKLRDVPPRAILRDDFVDRMLCEHAGSLPPHVRPLLDQAGPVGCVLRACLRVDPRHRITMAEAQRILSCDAPLLPVLAEGIDGDLIAGLMGPLDEFEMDVERDQGMSVPVDHDGTPFGSITLYTPNLS